MVEIREVKSKSDLRRFVAYPNKLYRDVPQFMPPLRGEDMADWDRKKNPAFEYCDAKCYLALRNGEIVGRIGAILSRRSNEKWNKQRMRFTQVDFIDDIEVSTALFEAVEAWAREMGCNEVHGPLGFTDLDREGMLVEGFDQKSMFITYYNHPYYIDHLTRLGYVKDVDWVEFLIDVPQPGDRIVPRLQQLSDRVLRSTGLHVAQVRHRRDFRPYIEKVFDLINTCYAHLYGTVELLAGADQKICRQVYPNDQSGSGMLRDGRKRQYGRLRCGCAQHGRRHQKERRPHVPLRLYRHSARAAQERHAGSLPHRRSAGLSGSRRKCRADEPCAQGLPQNRHPEGRNRPAAGAELPRSSTSGACSIIATTSAEGAFIKQL